ncbi:uncharacterized protein LOC110445933 [Mizuhopecten yessoensis]|uniref:uncharacterized protein LOC110445933 n=1 Tax=Mizuhopecten yessoensis TaxID=6573 RepID=UPI000B457589|nr:uncharacterized protein LOC110445933 [Mizuhopecten yessoensis]
MADKYFIWSVGKLKQELIRRGAVTRGRKVDLVERLKSYDRNFNFQTQPIKLPNQVDAQWPAMGYHQLVQNHKVILPKLTSFQIEEYFLYRLAGDKNASADVKALRKGKDLLDSDRILACSVLMEGNNIYFSGMVGAAMKNKVNTSHKFQCFLIVLMDC